jgi:DNA polymerase III gamma/tau subunit
MKFSDFPKHHALLITHTNRISYGEELWKEISSLSPIHQSYNQTVLDIETARSIISFAQAPYHGEKIALISFHSASLPAQNALLKVLEEPRGGMRFILLTTNKNNLIDTILSRVQHVHIAGGKKHDAHAKEFLAAPSSARMKLPFVLELLAKLDEEGRKDREAVKGFILDIAEELRQNHLKPRYVLETLEIASYASDPSASGKALLEYLALLLPQMKE